MEFEDPPPAKPNVLYKSEGSTARAASHINDFIRVQVHFKNGMTFPVILDINSTVGYAAKQIEVAALCQSLPKVAIDSEANTAPGNTVLEDVVRLRDGIHAKTIEVYQLYDGGTLPIPFTSRVGESLVFDEDIFPITSFEDNEKVMAQFDILLGSAFSISPEAGAAATFDKKKTILSSKDHRLASVLHNSLSMQFLNEFCLQEYSIENILFWIEIEVYRSITDEKSRQLFAKHLVLSYVKYDSPLCLNISDHVRANVIESSKGVLTSETFDVIQTYVYILIKQHAYVRFESSQLFQNFLKFKNEDRYAYTQGKTDWNILTLAGNKDNKIFNDCRELVKIMETAGSTESLKNVGVLEDYPVITSSLFRHRVLTTIISHYFPASEGIPKSYFDSETRQEWGRKHRQVQKQRRLLKFFGSRPTQEHMTKQTLNDSDSEPDSVLSVANTAESCNNEDKEKRKKVEKLMEFFGGQLPKKHLKKQNLHVSEIDSIDCTSKSSQLYDNQLEMDPEFDFLITVNELGPEEKLILTKRAKKLLVMLGTKVDSETVLKTRQKIDTSTPISPLSPSKILTESGDDLEEDGKMNQKQRLTKLSYVMGHRIGEQHIQTTVVDSSQMARPLTLEEKKIFKRKSGKLERLLGSTVPPDNIVNYVGEVRELSSMEDFEESEALSSIKSCDFESPAIQSESEGEDDGKKSKVVRLRKLRKVLGLHEGVTSSTSSLRQTEEKEDNLLSEIEKAKRDPRDEVLKS